MTKPLANFDFNLAKDGITQSSLQTFLSCRRKWVLQHSGLRKKSSKTTFYGTMMHEMLDQLYDYREDVVRMNPKDLTEWVTIKLETYLEEQRDTGFHVSGEQEDLEKYYCIVMAVEYVHFFIQDFKTWVDVETEIEFDQMYKGTKVLGKIDGVITDSKGNKWQLQHKNKSRIDEENIYNQLKFDFQNLFYSLVLQKLMKVKLKGTVYNVLRKPSLKKKATETPKQFIERVREDVQTRLEHYFKRYEICYSTKDFEKFETYLDGMLDEIKLFLKGTLKPLQNSAFCLNPFKCDYLDVCTANDTSNFEMIETSHPELDRPCRTFPEVLFGFGIRPLKTSTPPPVMEKVKPSKVQATKKKIIVVAKKTL